MFYLLHLTKKPFMNLRILFVLCCLAAVGMPAALGQQAIVPAGGEASGPDGTSSYSVGQLVVATNEGPEALMAEGVQQPFEISTSTGDHRAGISLAATAFPNPTSAALTLQFDELPSAPLHYRLLTIAGEQLMQQPIATQQETIALERFASGTYLLEIQDRTTTIKSFKIIKH